VYFIFKFSNLHIFKFASPSTLSTCQLHISALLLTFLTIAGIQAIAQPVRERLSLEGTWQFHLQDSAFKETVNLPGTLEENKKGHYVTRPTTNFLNQTYKYEGAAWYKKEIVIPASFTNKQVTLFLERTKATHVWIDDTLVGHSELLSAPQVYALPGKLLPGKHTITIQVDNTPALFPVGGSHALSEHTQTNWNGIIGNIYLEAVTPVNINRIKVTPHIKNKMAQVQVSIVNNKTTSEKIQIELQAATWNTPVKQKVPPRSFPVAIKPGDTILTFQYPLGKQALLWSEYTPALYQLTVNLYSNHHKQDNQTISFGLREFSSRGTRFRINEVITFLRGKNESCVFPLTGHPPMDTASWRKRFRIAKQYGINHYRFHSWTPPAAAFEAADVEGIYIQTELPDWAELTSKDSARVSFQLTEGKAILDAYGNHPSFVMLSLGNELTGDKTVLDKLVTDLRAHDGRQLYAHGTNAFYAHPAPGKTDDFWVTMRTGPETPERTYDVRGSFAATEDTGSGIINSTVPSTRRNFSAALRGVQLPVIGHETGQYQIYPDYSEIKKYTGVLRPVNFEIFKKRLQDAGMAGQAVNFCKASGMLAALLYREEIEMALRTPGFAGFQLLDLQDFPGQGTALVGLLNAFMENKGFISAPAFRRLNNDVVLQLLMNKYTWVNTETFTATAQVVNYSPKDITNKTLNWSIITADHTLATGKLPVRAEKGKINPLGSISFPLRSLTHAVKLIVRLEIPGTAYSIDYPLWVYPKAISVATPANLSIATQLNDELFEKLNKGERVLLFPGHKAIENKSVGGQFISEFWNWLVFKGAAERSKRKVSAGTLGILTNPRHPLFKYFPTEFYTNWQWFTITKNARPLILDSTGRLFRPIVQVIDNIDRNHKLGMIFECKIGKGRLLVSMANLPALLDKPEARMLYYSMLKYASSDEFAPEYEISVSALKKLML
jgi:hypothetical protein